jgi:hypothetical protein
VTAEPYGGTATEGARTSSSSGRTSSLGGTVTAGPCGTGTSSSSGRTATVLGYDDETSSSIMCMFVALEASSSSYITCIANWSGETSSSRRQRLDSPNRAMAKVYERCWWVVCGYE